MNPTTPQTLSRLLHVAVNMPPLVHYPDRERRFRIEDSPVANWLASQHDLRQWLFNGVATRNLIVFDKSTGLWRGNPARLKPVAHPDDLEEGGGGVPSKESICRWQELG
jgi:hypothetical protein